MCTDSFAFLLVRKKIEMFLQEERRGVEAVYSRWVYLKNVKILNIYNWKINIKKTIDVLK